MNGERRVANIDRIVTTAELRLPEWGGALGWVRPWIADQGAGLLADLDAWVKARLRSARITDPTSWLMDELLSWMQAKHPVLIRPLVDWLAALVKERSN